MRFQSNGALFNLSFIDLYVASKRDLQWLNYIDWLPLYIRFHPSLTSRGQVPLI